MYKILDILMIFVIIIFTYTIYKYYSSNRNIENKDYNRSNKSKILKEKLSNLPVLLNDTNDVIEFNNSFENEINNEKKRSFWNLLKDK